MHRGEKRVVVLILLEGEVLNLGDQDVGHLSSRKCRDSASLLLEGGAKSLAKRLLWWVSVKQNALAEALNPHLSQKKINLWCLIKNIISIEQTAAGIK